MHVSEPMCASQRNLGYSFSGDVHPFYLSTGSLICLHLAKHVRLAGQSTLDLPLYVFPARGYQSILLYSVCYMGVGSEVQVHVLLRQGLS